MKNLRFIANSKLCFMKPTTFKGHAIAKVIDSSRLYPITSYDYDIFEFPKHLDVYVVDEDINAYNDNIFAVIDWECKDIMIYEGDANNIIESISFEVRR